MAGGYTTPPTGDFGALMQRFEDQERRIRELERPTGTQNAQAVATLIEQQAELSATVTLLSRIDNRAERDLNSNLQFTTTETIVASETFVAPDYPSIATFTAVGIAIGRNQSGGTDTLRAQIEAVPSAGSTGQSVRVLQSAVDGAYATATTAYSADLTLDPLETVRFDLIVRTQSNTWVTDINNIAQITYHITLQPVV